MSKGKRNYSTDFKKKAVELSYARASIAQVCRELDIPTSASSPRATGKILVHKTA